MRYYSYENFRDDMKILVGKLDTTPSAIVAIARGGLTMGHFLGIALDIRNIFTINATLYFNKQKELLQISNIPSLEGHEHVLVVDDIVDSGESMSKVCQILSASNPSTRIQSAAIFYKDSACIMPTYTLHRTEEWIEFFWEVDVLDGQRIEQR